MRFVALGKKQPTHRFFRRLSYFTNGSGKTDRKLFRILFLKMLLEEIRVELLIFNNIVSLQTCKRIDVVGPFRSVLPAPRVKAACYFGAPSYNGSSIASSGSGIAVASSPTMLCRFGNITRTPQIWCRTRAETLRLTRAETCLETSPD